MQFPNQPLGVMEGCESCTLSHSMDGTLVFHVSILLMKKVITKRRLILDMQFLIHH